MSSVNGRTGTITLVSTDVSAASASHTHVAANITDFTTEAAKYGPVSSVNGRTGTITLVSTDVSAASASHTHVVANITDFGAGVRTNQSVSSVNGRTGTVTLVSTDVSAASASHTHVAASITDFVTEAAKVGPVSSVNGKTGTITLVATDVSAAKTVLAVETRGPLAIENNYNAGTSDIVRISATAATEITGLSGGQSGVVKLLVNVGTNDVTFVSDSVESESSNRITIVGGNKKLSRGEAASAFYDPTSNIWRIISDPPSAPAYSWRTLSVTAALNNYNPGTHTVLRLSANSAHLVTGFSGGGEGSILRLINVATHTVTLVHASTASDSSNRLLLDTGTDRTLDEDQQAELLYDPASLRWRVTP